MVEFCCCNLKPKSFYLLMIFISCLFYLTAFLEVQYVGLTDPQYALMGTFAIFILLTVFYHHVISIVAFIHYVVWDGINYKYCHFYAFSMLVLVYILAALDLAFFLAFIVNPGRTKLGSTLMVSIYFVVSIALLVVMWFWSKKLIDLMPKLEDDNTKPIEDNSGHEETPKAKKDDNVKVVSEKTNV